MMRRWALSVPDSAVLTGRHSTTVRSTQRDGNDSVNVA